MTPYDNFGQRFASEYGLFLFALMGRYQQLRAAGVGVTPHAVTELRRDCFALAVTFREIAESQIDNYLAPMLSDATDELTALLKGRRESFATRVRASLAENVQQVSLLSKTGIGGVANLLRGTTGAIGLLVQASAGTIEFVVTDTSGRKWKAKQLMRVVARDFAYQAFIDRRIEDLRNQGADQVRTSAGDIFRLDDFDTRRSLFHPNSNMTFDPYVQA